MASHATADQGTEQSIAQFKQLFKAGHVDLWVADQGSTERPARVTRTGRLSPYLPSCVEKGWICIQPADDYGKDNRDYY